MKEYKQFGTYGIIIENQKILEEVTLKNCIKFSSNLQIIEYHQKNMEEIIHEIIN